MGIKAFKVMTVILTLTLFFRVDVAATTVSDIYNLYDKDINDMYPKTSLKTIAEYERYKREAAMYKYVQKSSFDDTLVSDKISTLERKLKRLESHLVDAYDLSINEIYKLEDEYQTALNCLSNTKKSSQSYDVKLPNKRKSPSEKKYRKALSEKEAVDFDKDVGKLPIKYPISGEITNSQKTSNSVTFEVGDGSVVSPIINGKVLKVTRDSITLSHDYGIYSYYKGFEEILVKEGEMVYQGQKLGYCKKQISFKFKINNDLVDVSKLFQEG